MDIIQKMTIVRRKYHCDAWFFWNIQKTPGVGSVKIQIQKFLSIRFMSNKNLLWNIEETFFFCNKIQVLYGIIRNSKKNSTCFLSWHLFFFSIFQSILQLHQRLKQLNLKDNNGFLGNRSRMWVIQIKLDTKIQHFSFKLLRTSFIFCLFSRGHW